MAGTQRDIVATLSALLLKYQSRLKYHFDSVISRMTIVIVGSVLPVAMLGALLIWQDYARLEDASIRRSETVLTQLLTQLRQDRDHAIVMLDTIGQVTDVDSLRRLLLLAQSASGTRYCFLGVVSHAGKIEDAVLSPQHFLDDGCKGFLRDINLDNSTASVQIIGNLPYLRIVRPVEQDGVFRSLIAVQPLTWSRLDTINDVQALQKDRDFSSQHSPLAIWFISPDGSFVSTCPECKWDKPPRDVVTPMMAQSSEQGSRAVSVRKGGRAYTYDRVPGLGAILIEASLRPEEHRAVILLGAWVVMVTLMLGAGLVGMMVASRRLVIHPLRQLTDAVGKWMKTNVFDSATQGPMPREFRQLSTAFGLATDRLALRERELGEAMEHQKELVAEIHHRVKNNLQIIGSLLSLQANRTDEPMTRVALLLARDRVRALSLLHHYLYQDGGLSGLNMQAFVPALCDEMYRTAPDSVRIRVAIEVSAAAIIVSPSQATPVALIIAEAVSNALDHAFPGDVSGQVRVSLHQADGQITLIVEDNGVGLEATRRPDAPDGLGFQLIRGFVRQIGGTLHIEDRDGVGLVVQWPLQPAGAADEAEETATLV
ncbi:sensor histidine kinase [Acetobacter sp.]|uniref:sensor histidine kinase n=1 Tax=Acetobacter sp. TaxID=440 RepID=UPI0039EC7F92